MSDVHVGRVLQVIFGLLSSESYTERARILRKEDLSHEQCRELIVGELKVLKTNIPKRSGKCVLSSDIGSFEEALLGLNLSAECSKESTKTTDEGEISTESSKGCTKATEASTALGSTAFDDESVRLEDRIVATKLCIASKVLQNLHNNDIVIPECIEYLEKLHNLPEIQEVFNIYLNGGWKALFFKRSRLETVISVTTLNYTVYNLVRKFSGTKSVVKLLTWPVISIGATTYNPLLANDKILREMNCPLEIGELFQDEPQPEVNLFIAAIDSHGFTLGAKSQSASEIVINASATEQKCFTRLPEEDTSANEFGIVRITIDCNNNVFVLIKTEPSKEVKVFKLYCYNTSGTIINMWVLDFVDSVYPAVAISKNGEIIIVSNSTVYICENDSGKLRCKAQFTHETESMWARVAITDNNEIIIAPWFNGSFITVYSMDGSLLKKFRLPELHQVWGMVVNYVTNEILLYSKVEDYDAFYLHRYTISGEPLEMSNVNFFLGLLLSHPSGAIVVLSSASVLRLQ